MKPKWHYKLTNFNSYITIWFFYFMHVICCNQKYYNKISFRSFVKFQVYSYDNYILPKPQICALYFYISNMFCMYHCTYIALNPIIWHITDASFTPNDESQIVPHCPFLITSTRPSQGPAPLTSRTSVWTTITWLSYSPNSFSTSYVHQFILELLLLKTALVCTPCYLTSSLVKYLY